MSEESEGTLVAEPVPEAWLTEAQALRECLWLMRGTNLKSPIFIVKGKRGGGRGESGKDGREPMTIRPNPKFCLTSLTPLEWENVVGIYGRYAIIRHRIDSFLDKVISGRDSYSSSSSSSSPNTSRTYQAFAGALNQLTKEDLGLVLESLENELIIDDRSSAVLTLTSCLVKLRPQMEMLDAIGDILALSVELDDVADEGSLAKTSNDASSNALKVTRLLSSMHKVIEHLDAGAPVVCSASRDGISSGFRWTSGPGGEFGSSAASFGGAKPPSTSFDGVKSRRENLSAPGNDGDGGNTIVSAMIWLWVQSLQPIVEMMDEWIRTGRLDDPTKEFFMRRNEDIELENDLFWSRGYYHAVSDATSSATQDGDDEPRNDADDDDGSQIHFFAPPIVKKVVLAGKSMEVIQSLLKTEGRDYQNFQHRRQFTTTLYADFVEALVKFNSVAVPTPATAPGTKKLRFASPPVENCSSFGDASSGGGSVGNGSSSSGSSIGSGIEGDVSVSSSTFRFRDNLKVPQANKSSHTGSRYSDDPFHPDTFFHLLDPQIQNELRLDNPDPLLLINFNQSFSHDLISDIAKMNEDPDRYRKSVVTKIDSLSLASKLRLRGREEDEGGGGGGDGAKRAAYSAATGADSNGSSSSHSTDVATAFKPKHTNSAQPHHSSSSSATPQYLHFPSFNHFLEAGLFPLVKKRSTLICRSLVDHLLQKSNLMRQLAALRAVYLLEAGDAMHTFCLEVFDQVGTGSRKLSDFLNFVLLFKFFSV